MHAFASGPIGPVFLGFFLLVLLVGFGLLSRTFADLQDAGEIRWVSREGALLVGMLLLLTLAFVVLLGTLWPLLVEATSGAKVSVGAPFFNQMMIPLGIGLLLFMGIGPLLPWKHSTPRIRQNLLWMGLALLAGMGFGLVMGWTPGVALTVGLFAYNSVAVGLMLQRGIEDRVRSLRVSTLRAFRDIAVTNRRRFGSHIIHLGVALLALAIAFSQAYRVEAQKTLRIGESWRVMGLELRLQRVGAMEERNRFAVVATVQSPTLGLLRPRLNFYPTMQT